MTLLVDLFDHVMGSDDNVRQEAADMFNTMPDLSSDEGNPTYAADEPPEKVEYSTRCDDFIAE